MINAVHNKNNFILTVLDNRITAMTGGQPNPGIPVDGMGDDAPEISIRKLALACGCNYVRVINPLNLDQVVKTRIHLFPVWGQGRIVLCDCGTGCGRADADIP